MALASVASSKHLRRAGSPLGPVLTSKLTRWFSVRVLKPSALISAKEVRIGMKGEAFQQGAPGLLSGRGPDVHLRQAQPLLQGVRLVRLQRILGSLRRQGPSFLQQAQHPPDPVRKGQRPLPVGHVRQHLLHPVHRRHMRPLRVAGGAHPSSLAREGDEQLVLATLAAHPREAVRQHSAFQVPGEVPLHIPGQVRPPVRSHLPLPSHISPGHTLPSASHGSPWSPCLLVGIGAYESKRQQTRAGGCGFDSRRLYRARSTGSPEARRWAEACGGYPRQGRNTEP